MPSIAEATIPPLIGRKRRKEDLNSIEVQMKLSRYVDKPGIFH
jgi:hypothetical protein